MQAEIDNKRLSDRIRKFEDPIGHMHDDIPRVIDEIYNNLKTTDKQTLSFDKAFYDEFRRPLAMLESQGFIKGNHSISVPFYAGLELIDPSFILYMAALLENQINMQNFIKIVDSCEPGKLLNGTDLASEHYLPKTVVKAVFKVYQSKNLGITSKETTVLHYVGRA